jgi:uncharacterized membrane protein
MSKGLKVIFVTSIVLNVLFIGVSIGHFSKRAAIRGMMKADVVETIGHLPEDKQELILSSMKKLRSETRRTKMKADKTREELIDTLSAEEFNPERFENEARELHVLLGVLMMDMAATVSDLAQKLDREEREALSDFIEEMRKHRRHGGPPGLRHREHWERE